jgi:hypothetical protein
MMPLACDAARCVSRLASVGILVLVLSGCEPVAETAKQPVQAGSAASDVHEFTGSWNATGNRRTVPLGAGRRSSILDLHGTVLLAGEGRPDVGFRADAIALVDSATGLSGRSAWTDEHGDQIFSEIVGEGAQSANHVAGTFLGGTGRYAGASGAYEFTWKFMVESDDGSVQGDAVGLKGSVRFGPASAEGSHR